MLCGVMLCYADADDRLKGSSGGAELAAAVASTGRDREDQNDSD